jgi:hypothetical protein
LSVFPHLFRMNIASRWYDAKEAFARTYEMEFTTSRKGSPHSVRRTLARRGIPYFQQEIYRRHRVWIPLRQIRVSYEREELAEANDRAIEVLARSMRYRGKQWAATKLPRKVIPYAKKRRRAKTRKGKRAKGR